jgi:hypothetical protein
MWILSVLCVGFIVVGIGAVILRMACAFYNAIVGGRKSPKGVPEPAMLRAMGITFVTFLAQWAVSLGLGLLRGASADAAGKADAPARTSSAGVFVSVLGGSSAAGAGVLPSLLSIVAGLLVMSMLLTALLPTTVIRAMLVALLEYVLMIVLFAILIVAGTLIFGPRM